MKTIGAFLFLIIAILEISFIPEKSKGFVINGTLSGMPDSTLILLDDVTDGTFKNIDSSFIVNGKFKFSGSIKENAVSAALRTKDYGDRVYFWLENSTINFTGEKGKSKEAKITGSKTQDDQNDFEAFLKTAKDQNEGTLSFIRSHPQSIISARLLSVYCSTWGKDLSAGLYKS